MKQKTIVLTRFPYSDLSGTKRRPALVISHPKPGAPDLIVAFISSQIPRFQESTDYVLLQSDREFRQTGLSKSSVFKMDKLATLDSGLFVGRLGEVSDSLFEELQNRLRIALDLPG